MAGLTDMEELVATVSEKDIAIYLKEAMTCYGAGAYRGCVVLTHIALFEGLRQKLSALAPVNATAKSISDHIEPLASAQKVFETTLIQKMKAGAIITHLEADILEQLNKQRNKAAHPSGHIVTAEEARFVFSEAIQKFLSLPIRQTSVVVDGILERLSGPNFFPSMTLSEIAAVVDHELEALDPSGLPQLVSKLVAARDSKDSIASRNANSFLLALSRQRKPTIRKLIVKHLIDAKSNDDLHAEPIFTVVSVDPEVLSEVQGATKLRVKALMLKHTESLGFSVPYAQLRNPARAFANCVNVLGEDFILNQHKEFSDKVVAESPCIPEFIDNISGAPVIFSRVIEAYCKKAASSEFSIANTFSEGIPFIDAILAEKVSERVAFKVLAAVRKGAEWGSFGASALCSSKFSSCPNLKAKAAEFVKAESKEASEELLLLGLNVELDAFLKECLN